MEKVVSEDKEINFDIPNLHLINGEEILCEIKFIEDARGNPGDTGKLQITPLRLIWYSLTHKKFNLSIGFQRITSINDKEISFKKRKKVTALSIYAAGVHMRFEFLFIDLSSPIRRNVFGPIFEVHKMYQQTTLHREVKLRSSIIQSGQLLVLNNETIFNTLNGVWNLSSDQGNLGVFIISNIRLVWYAEINESFNISIPYMQISNIKARDSKYGPALVIQTMKTGGNYILGFRIDPQERLANIQKELNSIIAIYAKNPVFGVKISYTNCEKSQEIELSKKETEHKQRPFEEVNMPSKLNFYVVEGTQSTNLRKPFYCKELGFSMEGLKDGYNPSDLWEIFSSKQ